MQSTLRLAVLIGAAVPSLLHAGVLTGTIVNDGGDALNGVMVRLTDDVSGRSESVYTDASGNFRLATTLAGNLELRLRTPYYRDLRTTVDLGPAAVLEQDHVMTPMTDAREISETLPAAYHFGSLPFQTGENDPFNRLEFQRDCLSCHQLGNPFTRIKRTPESWAVTIERMHRYLGNFDKELRDARAVILSEGFGGPPLDVRPKFPVDESLARAKVYEYRLTRAVVPHDTIFNPDDGLLYTVDQALDQIAVTDMKTGETEYVPQQHGAGMSYLAADASSGKPVIGEFDPGASHGPHSLDLGRDGRYYVTNTGTRSIGVFDPKTRKWEPAHRIPAETGAVYPHTIRVARSGMVWFTLAGSEHVGRLDPATDEFTIVDLPPHEPLGVAGTTQPYGIDIHPEDDSVWYGRLFADRIGRIDPITLAVVEYESPVSGPRRMRFDADGTLWVTGYSEGMLAKIDVDGGFESTVYEMPAFAPGFRPAPYALGVHPETQEIWINENMTDRLFRFIPSEERFVVYPVPLSGTYTRDMTFTADGRVCTSNNPLPVAALEGGVLQLLCIDADYRAGGVPVAARESDRRNRRFPSTDEERAMIPVRTFEDDLQGIRTLGPDVRVTLMRDPAVPDEAVLSVSYPAAASDPAGRDVWIDAENQDWTSGRGITLRVKPDQPIRLSVSFLDRNGVAYTSWSNLAGGAWQRVEIPFDTIEPNPYFQPPGADTAAPLDVSEVKRIGFAPQSPEAGHLAITGLLVE